MNDILSLQNQIEDENKFNTSPVTNNLSTTLTSSPIIPVETNISSTDMEQDNAEIRVLRNRTITTNDTPKTNRRSKRMTPKSVSKKENKSPIKLHKKSLSKLSQKDEDKHRMKKENVTEIQDNVLTENVDKRRKSSRKSVAFSDDNCLVCFETKPVLPMTPYVRKRKSQTPSRQNRNKNTLDEDLILFTTPEHLPNRVTRSHTKN